MTRTPPITAALLSLTAALTLAQGPMKVAWELTEGVQAPESAYLDPASGFLFLSQIGGGGGKAKDGDGFISKLMPDGKVVQAKWFSGLNAPKGLRSHRGTLWVADIDRVVGINIGTGKTVRVVNIEGAQFLNDVAAGPDGTIYVSDMPASRIYQIANGKASVFAEGQQLDSPNGLLVQGGRLIIGGWGKALDKDFNAELDGRLLSLELKTKAVTPITKGAIGNLDGVESDGGTGYFVTDWRAGTLFHIAADGTTRTLLMLPRGTADHAYLASKKLLILPRMLENKVTAYDLSGFKP